MDQYVGGGVGGLKLAKSKQNRLKMAWFSPGIFPIEQSLNQGQIKIFKIIWEVNENL